jgi:two-component system sensor histidine kinase MtrB
VRARLIAAFIVVALLAALASAWVVTLIVPFYPSLGNLIRPALISHLLGSHVPGTGPGRRPPEGPDFPARATVLAFVLVASGLLLATITGLAFAAARRVLGPVRRLARAAQQMSGGDLSVRVEPAGRDELAQLVTTFNTMASALQDKVGELEVMEARARRFAGDVSHELRTPLTAMTAVADILGDDTAASVDGTAAARLVAQEIRHLNRLVEDLIEISRFDAGSAQLIAEDTDVAAAVQECLRARNWADACPEVPAGLTVRLDRRRFDVIVANLVGNALRHGAPPVTVRASIQAGRAGGSELVLEVRDHGPGLPAGAIGHVFDRFYKADSARARSEGSGLGLAIAQENARLHGGRIDAANDPGGGAVFTVRLPVH